MTNPAVRPAGACLLTSKRLVTLLIVPLAFLLSACGATIDTVLRIDKAGAGERVITATISAADVDQYVTGGIGALETTIAANLPPEMAFSGLSPNGTDYAATFTISFTSVEQYREKVVKILDAAEFSSVPEVSISTEESTFLKGVKVSENFSSTDLMEWLRIALERDGLVSATNSSNVFTVGKSRVDFMGASEVVYMPIEYSSGKTKGIQSVSMSTRANDDGTWERTISLAMSAAEYQSNATEIDAYFSERLPAGGKIQDEVDQSRDVASWNVTFAGDGAAITKGTNGLLDSDTADFHADADYETGGLTSQVELTDYATCDTICGLSVGPLESVFSVPTTWNPTTEAAFGRGLFDESAQEGQHTVGHSVSEDPLVFEVSPSLESIAVETSFGLTGSVTQTITFVFPELGDEQAEAVTRALTPPDGKGTLAVERIEPGTAYRLEMSAASGEEFLDVLQSVLPGSSLTLYSTGNFFHDQITAETSLNLYPLLGQAAVGEDIVFSYNTPPLHSASKTEGESFDYDDYAHPHSTLTAYVSYSGVSLAGIITLGVVLLLLVAGLILVLIFRKRISASLARRRAARQQYQALQPVADTVPLDGYVQLTEVDLLEYGPAAMQRLDTSLAQDHLTVPLPPPNPAPVALREPEPAPRPAPLSEVDLL